MPISPYMDRHNTNQAKMTINFIGRGMQRTQSLSCLLLFCLFRFFPVFIVAFSFLLCADYMVKPLFVALKKFSPGLSHFLDNLNHNRERWTNPLTGEPRVPLPKPSYTPIPQPASALAIVAPSSPHLSPPTKPKRFSIKSPLPLPSATSPVLTPHIPLASARVEVKANVLDLTVSFKRDIDESAPHTNRNRTPPSSSTGRARSNTLF